MKPTVPAMVRPAMKHYSVHIIVVIIIIIQKLCLAMSNTATVTLASYQGRGIRHGLGGGVGGGGVIYNI